MQADAELCLAKGTSLDGFTLHDADHGRRVAERMWEIMPEATFKGLSGYELALLLLAAYCHDVGMVPNQTWLHDLHAYLVTDAGDLPDDEREAFRRWLEDDPRSVTPPLGGDTPEQLAKARVLVAGYARHRHNDLSAEWIREHAVDGPVRFAVDDLSKLCGSHHAGYDELIKPEYDCTIHDGQPVNLRYLAAVLRVADYLDISPERTPEVILRQRDLTDDNLVHWRSNQVSNVTVADNQVSLVAEPSSAVEHKAIADTAEGIRAELVLCRRLAVDGLFAKRANGRAYEWTLHPHLEPRITPHGGAYVYIEGAFRPNTERLLQMLGGMRLYENDRFAPVRELIQNAFDAVRECMAYQRLKWPVPESPLAVEALPHQHVVGLRLEQRYGRDWLVCTDTGAGLTRDVIENHLLVSGSGRRRDIAELERRCAARGFATERTGQFGIGVLSYFVLADQVEFTTRRCGEAGDGEGNGWVFTTEGVGTFGELRRSDVIDTGTQVWLRLHKDRPEDWFGRLRAYLDDLLVRPPCRFELRGADATQCRSLPPGWSDFVGLPLRLATELAPSGRTARADEVLSQRSRQARESQASRFRQCVDRAAAEERWLRSADVVLPSGGADLRVSVPCYDLPDGCCLLHVVDETDPTAPLRHGARVLVSEARFRSVSAWRGLRLEVRPALDATVPEGYTVWPSAVVDWADAAGTLHVSRQTALLAPGLVEEARQAVEAASRSMCTEVVARTGPLALLNAAVLNDPLPPAAEPLCWPVPTYSSRASRQVMWHELAFPIAMPLAYPVREGSWTGRLGASSVLVIEEAHSFPSTAAVKSLGARLAKQLGAPDQYVLCDRGAAYAVWSVRPEARRGGVARCHFPPGWDTVLASDWPWGWGVLTNPGHPSVSGFDGWGLERSYVVAKQAVECASQLQADGPKRAGGILWLLDVAAGQHSDTDELLASVADEAPDWLPWLWHELLGEQSQTNGEWTPICIADSDDDCLMLTPDGCTSADAADRARYMPTPPDDWILHFTDDAPADA